MTVGGIAVAWRPTAERGSTSKPHPDHEVEASEEIRMERKNGNITTLMLGASTCSENRLSRLISHLRQATVIGFSAMTLLILAFPAQGGTIGFTNGSFSTVTTVTADVFSLAGVSNWNSDGGYVFLELPGGATRPFAPSNGGTLYAGLGCSATDRKSVV